MKTEFPAPEPCGGQFARILHVGGEEEVEGRPIADLGEEIAGGAVSDVQLHRGMSGAKLGGDLLHGEVQVGGGGDAELLGVRRRTARKDMTASTSRVRAAPFALNRSQ